MQLKRLKRFVAPFKNSNKRFFINSLQFYNDPELNVFFNGFKCTLLYLDLLYKSQGYQEIIEIDKKCRNTIWAKRTNSLKFIDVLVFGACYKLVKIIILTKLIS